mgnify:CR=1 FL=1
MTWHLFTIRADVDGDMSDMLQAVQDALPSLTNYLESYCVEVVEMTDDGVTVLDAPHGELDQLLRRACGDKS